MLNVTLSLVRVSSRAKVEDKIAEISRRLAKKGIEPFSFVWGEAFDYRPDPDKDHTVAVSDLTLTGPDTHLPGWAFLATVEHLRDAETREVINVFHKVPGAPAEVPEEYRNRGTVCDHCNTKRYRSETYIIRNTETGATMQVGSDCMAVFLPNDRAVNAILAVTAWDAITSVATSDDDGEGGGRGSGAADEMTLTSFLPWVAACVRARGFTSKAKAGESEGDLVATATAAATLCGWYGPKERADFLRYHEGWDKVAPDAADAETAVKVREWAKSLPIGGDSEYLSNLSVIARSNVVSGRSIGFAASMVSAWERAMNREAERVARERADIPPYFGTVGKREKFRLILEFISSYETQYGVTYVYRFRNALGSVAIWKASRDQELIKGETYTLTGTVKAHDTYKDRPQTVLTRCKVEG